MRVLRELGMWDEPVRPPDRATTVVRHSVWERARRSGIVRIDVYPGQQVERGDVLGVLGDALGERRTPVRATRSGVVLGYTCNPLVSQGDAPVHIADLSDTAKGGPARPLLATRGNGRRVGTAIASRTRARRRRRCAGRARGPCPRSTSDRRG